jgi:hypothetical protein
MLNLSAIVFSLFLGGGGFTFAEISAIWEHRQGLVYQALRPRIPTTTEYMHRVATAAFWRTFHHEGTISTSW